MDVDSTLIDLIYDASIRAFRDWREEHPSEHVFAFALSTPDDAIYVGASLNSVESHQRRLRERQLDPESPYGLDAKWGPWEWENEYIHPGHFTVVDDRLKRMYDDRHENDFSGFRRTVLDSMVAVLVKLRDHAAINNNGGQSDVILFATIYDSFSAEAMHRRSAELLNCPEAVTELLAVIGG